MANLINLERVSKSYGVRPLLDHVSLGISVGERVGVVGRNGGWAGGSVVGRAHGGARGGSESKLTALNKIYNHRQNRGFIDRTRVGC